MSLRVKQLIIALLGGTFLASLIFVQYMEIMRKKAESGDPTAHLAIPESSKACIECHTTISPGIIDHWKGSRHARRGIGCVECHQAMKGDADAFEHYGALIAAIVTPKDCSHCHVKEAEQFDRSHHSKAANILASLDNILAETIEGSRVPFNPHSPTLGREGITEVNGMASVNIGCRQCHGSKIALESVDGGLISVDELKPDPDNGVPTNIEVLARIKRTETGKPVFSAATWPNTGIGRINLDGSRGSCSACHSRHDFSPRRARQPENCGKCHLGPDHPQKEIYEESKHGVAYRDLKDKMNLDAEHWVLGKDYTAAPTCATCHMSGNLLNKGEVTHDPGERISWTNRPAVSLVMDTDKDHKVVTETDPVKRAELVTDTWEEKRGRMRQVCSTCHTSDYINNFYKQYDDFVVLYNEKFGKPGGSIIKSLRDQGLITKTDFDDKIEWTWYLLWHHEGRRARHGASMMAPDYAHWHGMYEVVQRFYTEFIPEAREIIHKAEAAGKAAEAAAAASVIDEIMARGEHAWSPKDGVK